METLLDLLFPPGKRTLYFRKQEVLQYLKAGGVTVDWSTVTAVTEETRLADGTIVKTGDKYIAGGTVLMMIQGSGKVGPFDSAAVDGRANVTPPVRARCSLLNFTVKMSESGSDHPPVLLGGPVRRSLLKVDGPGQPTTAQVLAMFPSLTFDDARDG